MLHDGSPQGATHTLVHHINTLRVLCSQHCCNVLQQGRSTAHVRVLLVLMPAAAKGWHHVPALPLLFSAAAGRQVGSMKGANVATAAVHCK
jgi:hypothetical protein